MRLIKDAKRLTPFLILSLYLLLGQSALLAQQISEKFKYEDRTFTESTLLYLSEISVNEPWEDSPKLQFLLESEPPKEWLEKRISYLIPEQKTFETSQMLPLMSNLGAKLYSDSKQRKETPLYSLEDHFLSLEDNKLVINSPRVGIVSVSQHYFSKENKISDTGDKEADYVSMLSLLFHEARHSDGNHESLGFSHTTCPESSDYVGLKVCDASYNGPYAISAEVLDHLISQCHSCSDVEKEVLQLMYFDFQGRIINDNAMTLKKKNEINDIQNQLDSLYEEKYYKNQAPVQNFVSILILKRKISILETRLNHLQNTELKNNTYWDPTPEYSDISI